MKTKLTTLMTLFILTLCCSPQSQVSSQHKKTESQANPAQATPAATSANSETSPQAAMKGLRDRLLTSSAEEVGLSPEDAKAKAWGVMMEVALSTGDVATLVSVRDGTASLYTSTGGGILGGHIARKEAKQFVAQAEKHLASMKPTTSFPYPDAGRIKFYVLTPEGVYTAEADEQELVSEQHALSPLFFAGNEVLTVLRTAKE